jgi:putative restriction endonuclease
MRLWVGITDNDWYRYLASQEPDEVNFWQPGGGAFRALGPGGPFLFKLHSPLNYIAGGGFFVHHTQLPLSVAWDAFEQKNGAPDFESFRDSIHRYRSQRGTWQPDPVIGCIVLAQPFFFPRDDWIPVPEDWHRNIVRGKTYATEETPGMRLWAQVQERLAHYASLPESKDALQSILKEERPRYGEEFLTQARLGQGAFRTLVTDAYQRRCAVTQERTLPVLQAGHIKPYAESGPHRVSNGILLRADLHILMDRGYMTLSDDLHVEVSRRIKEDFENGRDYYALHGQRLAVLPEREVERPSREFLRWHREHRYLGGWR